MKSKTIPFALFALAGLPLSAQTPRPAGKTLDAGWLGDWKGTLEIEGGSRSTQRVPMELHLQKLKDRNGLRWEIVYGEGPQRQIRRYELLSDPKTGQFVIDEKNGILMDAAFVGQTLYSQFEVGSNRLSSRYEREGETIKFEITTFSLSPRSTGEKEAGTQVLCYPLLSVQRATLLRAGRTAIRPLKAGTVPGKTRKGK